MISSLAFFVKPRVPVGCKQKSQGVPISEIYFSTNLLLLYLEKNFSINFN